MNIKTTVALAITLSASACAVSADRPSLRIEGVGYSQLTGESLRTAIEGQAFSFPKGEVITSPRCNVFNGDGTYMQCGDRVPLIHGRYVTEQDQVCATVMDRYTTCWQL